MTSCLVPKHSSRHLTDRARDRRTRPSTQRSKSSAYAAATGWPRGCATRSNERKDGVHSVLSISRSIAKSHAHRLRPDPTSRAGLLGGRQGRVIVDDIHSRSTIARDDVSRRLRPASRIRLAVLVDSGHRELPIVPTRRKERADSRARRACPPIEWTEATRLDSSHANGSAYEVSRRHVRDTEDGPEIDRGGRRQGPAR